MEAPYSSPGTGSFGASLAGRRFPDDALAGWRLEKVCGSKGDENIDCMVTRRRLERRER
jgi:hypothetical protein